MTLLLTQPAAAARIWPCRQPAPTRPPTRTPTGRQRGEVSPRGTATGDNTSWRSTAGRDASGESEILFSARQLWGSQEGPRAGGGGTTREAPADLPACAQRSPGVASASPSPQRSPQAACLGYVRLPNGRATPTYSLLTNSTQAQLMLPFNAFYLVQPHHVHLELLYPPLAGICSQASLLSI